MKLDKKYLFLYGLLLLFIFSLNANKNPHITIGFAGDTMLGRQVSNTIERKGPDYIWGDLLPILKNNDFNVLNLETTLSTSQKAVPKVFNFKSNPTNVEALKRALITIVNIANNHILDYDKEGLLQTVAALDAAHIKHVGAGVTLDEAKQPVILKKNGITIGILGYTNNEPTWLAEKRKPGTNYIAIGDIETIKKDIQEIRKQVDVLIISFHWGPNLREKPTKEYISFAHQMIDAGVDIIHGHSAHIFQGIEIYKDKLIMYDTGDFVDDYAVDPKLRNDQSFLFQVTIDKNGPKEVLLIPTLIKNMQVNKASRMEYFQILKRMNMLSKEFNTSINGDLIVIRK